MILGFVIECRMFGCIFSNQSMIITAAILLLCHATMSIRIL